MDTYRALILPAVGWPFGIFLMKQFSHSVPDSLLESADIDGCGEIKKFVNIVLPIVKPGIGALAYLHLHFLLERLFLPIGIH